MQTNVTIEKLVMTGTDKSGPAVASARRGIKGMGKDTTRLDKNFTKTFKSMALRIGAVAAAFLVARKAFSFIAESIELAGVQEAAEKSLAVALGFRSQALLDQASALQEVTIFGDEAIIAAQAMIAAFVKDEDQIKAATKATLDLAAAKGMSLKAASDIVSKTLGSTTNALTRYGIEVEGAVGSTERLSSLVTNISDKFGGQAAAQADIFTGKLKQLGNVFGDIKEQIGFSVTQSDDFIDSIGRVIKVAKASAPALVELAKGIAGFAEAWVIGAGKILDVLVTTDDERIAELETSVAQQEKILTNARENMARNQKILAGEGGFFGFLRPDAVTQRSIEANQVVIERTTASIKALKLEIKAFQAETLEPTEKDSTSLVPVDEIIAPQDDPRIRNELKLSALFADIRKREADAIATDQERQLMQLDAFSARRLQKFKDAGATRSELAQVQAQARSEREMLEAIQVNEREANAARMRIKIKADEDAARIAMEQQRINTFVGLADVFNQLAGQKSSLLFNTHKAFAAGQAGMDAWRASAAALANPPGPPFTIPIASLALAQGLLAVKNILSMKPGGAVSTSGRVGGGGGGGGGISAPTVTPTPVAQAQVLAGPNITINVSTLKTDEESLGRKLTELIAMATGDGFPSGLTVNVLGDAEA